MGGRIRGITGHRQQPLGEGWAMCASPPGAIDGPTALAAAAALAWTPARVPSTVAAALRAAGTWSLDGAPRRFDAEDSWWRCRFTLAAAAEPGEQLLLCCDGLATIADLWLDGAPLFRSEGMFVAHEQPLGNLAAGEHELTIRFAALDTALGAKRPRPRVRAPMVENQQIRWWRTTLLGRTPGWSPPAAAVGPWRPIRLEWRRGVAVDDVRLLAGGDGQLHVRGTIAPIGAGAVRAVELALERDGRTHTAALARNGEHGFAGHLAVPDVARWWPHTHGEPATYAARLHVSHDGGTSDVDLGRIGFRSVTLTTEDGDFAVHVNGARVFCRGGCWTPVDPVALDAPPAAVDAAIAQTAAAGMNMLRVGGTMVYESDAFHDACDARGVMVWQDFMFANLEYPDEDAAFVAAVTREATQQLARLSGRPSLTVLCGNSEGEQQAAMWGAPRERWAPRLFHDTLARLAHATCPDVPYTPSSAHGGAFPHQSSAGASSYYGVGAYLRPLTDARRAEVRFASECLAFANVPESHAMAAVPGGHAAKVHDPGWKSRVPRDRGAGWDFDDVRDHYLRDLFRVDPLALRYADHDRYLALSRVVSGEVMAGTFSEWRRARSVTRGGLVWFLRDLWPGAGWGVVDAAGAPKAAWHYLRRALAPLAISMSDEGGNGVALHVVNDRPAAVRGDLALTLWRAGEVRVAHASRPIDVPARSAIELNAAEHFDGFLDLSYAYRFGPPGGELLHASLGEVAAFHFPVGLPSTRELDVGLTAAAAAQPDGSYQLTVRTRRFAQSVLVEVEGFAASDNHFHLAPGSERRLRLERIAAGGTAPPRGTLQALNAEATAQIEVSG